MPRLFVIFEIAAMSVSFNVGFAGVSVNTSFVLGDRAADRLRVRRVDERELDAEARVDLRREPIRAAVRDVRDHRVIVGRQRRLEHDLLGGHARR